MKALTLLQPWASLVGMGHLELDPRDWTTAYRGLLAIHAKKSFPPYCRNLIGSCQRVHKALTEQHPDTGLRDINDALPLGCVVAIVHLTRVVDFGRRQSCAHAAAFGNPEECRYRLFFEHPRMLPEPIPARGKPGLWEWPEGDLYVR